MFSEKERFENGVIPRECDIYLAVIALQNLGSETTETDNTED